jgi:hypothetical protein
MSSVLERNFGRALCRGNAPRIMAELDLSLDALCGALAHWETSPQVPASNWSAIRIARRNGLAHRSGGDRSRNSSRIAVLLFPVNLNRVIPQQVSGLPVRPIFKSRVFPTCCSDGVIPVIGNDVNFIGRCGSWARAGRGLRSRKPSWAITYVVMFSSGVHPSHSASSDSKIPSMRHG